MTNIQIAAAVFMSALVAMGFHFSGYIAGQGSQKNGDWTFFGAMPLLMAMVTALAALISIIYFIFNP
jgi:hypothetical protein